MTFELVSAALKAASYAAALTSAGTVLAHATLGLRLADAPHFPVALVRSMGILLALAASGTALLFISQLGGEADAAALDAVFRSPLGVALAMQAGGGLILAAMAKRRFAIVGAVIVLAAFGVVGHAPSLGLVTSVTIIAHVAAAAWWFGGLWILLIASRQASDETYPVLVQEFSRQAVWVVALLVLVAFTTAAFVLDFKFDPSLAYQQGLLAKIGLTLLLLALAAINRLLLSPRLAAAPAMRSWLRRTLLCELVLFLCVFGVTGWLTTYSSPHDAANHHQADAAADATGPIAIVDAWAPAMPGGVGMGGGYMTIVNNQAVNDKLIGAESPWAERVTLHASKVENRIASMRAVSALPIPARKKIELQPGIYHLMFEGLYAPFVEGDIIPVTLKFEHAGNVEVKLTVHPVGQRLTHLH